MWHRQSPILWTPLIAVTLVTTARLLPADDQPASADGYKTVPVTVDGKTVPIRVKQQPDALAHASFPDELDHQKTFSATNPMANKTFATPNDFFAQGNADYKTRNQDAFASKTYTVDPNTPTPPDLDRKSSYSTTSAFSRSATEFDKNYATSTADVGQNQKALFAQTTSPDQGRTAVLGGQPIAPVESPLGDKTFHGDESDAAHRNLVRLQNGQMLVTDLPDRPLTVDEVRNLINHGFEPDTSVKPEGEPSKALNDPGYTPEPMRITPPPASANEDDKDDSVPPPGTIAQPPPENSQPLPQP